MKKIDTLNELAEKIRNVKNVTVLTHAHPDGDTIGAGFGLCYYLRSVGIKANVKNSEAFPDKFSYLFKDYSDLDFKEECVISVDVADTKLLGDPLSEYAEKVDICIDHHFSNKMFAAENYVDGDCCATCLIIYELLKIIGANISPLIADCLYTGIATDTGCFMYENASPAAHRGAAELLELGAHAPMINRTMFQIKSSGRLFAEQKLIGGMKFARDGKIALIAITNELLEKYKVERSELDAFAGIPLTVDGVRIGITLKQQADDPDLFKVSIRTFDIDASAIAANFGGGGHIRAAGCSVRGSVDEVADKVILTAEKYL